MGKVTRKDFFRVVLLRMGRGIWEVEKVGKKNG